jgi:hypothetical protein
MRATAVIALIAVLALSVGSFAHLVGKACCGATVPNDAGHDGLSMCPGICSTAALPYTPSLKPLVFAWFLLLPVGVFPPLLAQPIEKPPA